MFATWPAVAAQYSNSDTVFLKSGPKRKAGLLTKGRHRGHVELWYRCKIDIDVELVRVEIMNSKFQRSCRLEWLIDYNLFIEWTTKLASHWRIICEVLQRLLCGTVHYGTNVWSSFDAVIHDEEGLIISSCGLRSHNKQWPQHGRILDTIWEEYPRFKTLLQFKRWYKGGKWTAHIS